MNVGAVDLQCSVSFCVRGARLLLGAWKAQEHGGGKMDICHGHSRNVGKTRSLPYQHVDRRGSVGHGEGISRTCRALFEGAFRA